jgi:hypothetical protein
MEHVWDVGSDLSTPWQGMLFLGLKDATIIFVHALVA